MKEDNISDLPQFQELLKQMENFESVEEALPFLKLLGVDTDAISQVLPQTAELKKQAEELSQVPDQFNDLFSSRGWIIYDMMNAEVAKSAIRKAESGDMEGAEEELISYYNVENIEWLLRMMWSVKAFQSRIPLAEKALEDYKEGRYHASVPVVLALLDGMVNEVNAKRGERRGFFAEGVDLTAWNSVAGHNKGLTALVRIFQTSRSKTTTDAIDIPYRNGILHGMDLGYDNNAVAAKVWAALFATRDWVVKAEQGLLDEQPKAPEPTLPEILGKLEENERVKTQLSSWSPRTVKVGVDVPVNGDAERYQLNSPERKLVEYLFFWKNKNFGRMGQILSHLAKDTDNKTALMVRQLFDRRELQEFDIVNVEDEAPAITTIHVRIKEQEYGELKDRIVIARMINEDEMGQPMTHGAPKSEWRIIWYGLNHYADEDELRQLERELKIEQLRRFCPDVPQEETALLQRALQPAPQGERLEELLDLRENEAMTDEQHAELMQILEAREADNVERVSVVERLAELHGVKFQALWKELGLIPKGRCRVTG